MPLSTRRITGRGNGTTASCWKLRRFQDLIDLLNRLEHNGGLVRLDTPICAIRASGDCALESLVDGE